MSYPAHPAYDVVVVGSGPTGSAYVRTVWEQHPTARILLLDAGPRITDPAGAHVKNIPDDTRRAAAQRAAEGPGGNAAPTDAILARLPRDRPVARAGTRLVGAPEVPGLDGLPAAAVSTNVGGMGSHWTCACPRPGDSERIAFIPRAEMDAALAEAERLLHVEPDPFADAPFADVVRKRLAEVCGDGRPADRTVRGMPLAVTVHADGALGWSGTDVVLGDAASDARVEIADRAQCRRVLVEEGRVVGVRVRDIATGQEGDIAADAVVVAADALRTPQILYASGVRPAALGRYLNDQPQVVFAIRLPDDVVSGHRSALDRTRDASGAIVPQSGVTWVPFTDDHPFHGQVMQLDASPVPLGDDTLVSPGSIVGLGWFCAKELSADDRVEFSERENDPFAMPAPRIHYRLTEGDHATIRRAKEEVAAIGHALGVPLNGTPPALLPAGSSLHYQGTTRMGPADDGTSVCDSHSRVWGLTGLWVAGNNVIPTATACNPTLTSVALAVRGARALATTLPKA